MLSATETTTVKSAGPTSPKGQPFLTPRLAGHIFTICALLVWFAASTVLPPYVLPSPVAVASEVVNLLSRSGNLWHGFASVWHVVVALLFAFVIGTFAAGIAHYVPVTRLMIHGRINRFMNAFSSLGWTFLAIIWFGVNDFTVVFAMTAVLLPLIIINMREGFLQLDAETIEMAASFGKRKVRHFFKITLPLLIPYVAATLRICFGVAWIICLTVELFGGNRGYGYLLNRARMEYQVDRIFAIILIIIVVVYLADRLVLSRLQNRLRSQFDAG